MADDKPGLNATPPHEGEGFFVVGIGASAGGIGPLQEFFSRVRPDSGLGYVVILHLSAAHESILPEILQTCASIPVTQVVEPTKLDANHVYVIPPSKYLVMSDGMIRLTEPQRQRGAPTSIDLFFRTLADAYGRNSLAVLLSGTGADGTIGVGAIREQGGFVVAQDPAEAEQPDMPRSAINAGLVDLVLRVADMPPKLLMLRDSSQKLQDVEAEADPERPIELEERALREVLSLLRSRTGNDFCHYRRPTLLRRIARRMQVHQITDLRAYADFLRDEPTEVTALLRDMLITVTNFFRDPKAFQALETVVIPQLFEGKGHSDQIRVWSVGCATGDEAFSLAMLFSEYVARLSQAAQFQVFASDIDERALAQARESRYPDTIAMDVSAPRLSKFFDKTDGQYQVKKSLRESILFALHNVLRDPPFSRLDLICCRNLLIYLTREMQDRVLGIFHFALRPGGFLFLGSSESADNLSSLYVAVDKKYCIYRRRETVIAIPRPPALLPGRWFTETALPELRNQQQPVGSAGRLHQELVEQLAPPSVLTDEEANIVHSSANVGRFLRVPGGEPTRNLLKLAHPALQLDLHSALLEVRARGDQAAADRLVRASLDGQVHWIQLSVRRVTEPHRAQGFFLIIFDERSEPPIISAGARANGGGDHAVVQQLEQELQQTKDQLRLTIEQYETSTEELRASNEELQAINEELRSATEELETSKEELQSINEELSTVNQQYKEKLDELSRANSDLQNLITAMDIATVFLDRSLQIRRYTPRAQELFNITSSDIGRPLDHFTHKLDYSAMQPDAEKVLRTLQPLMREVNSSEGNWYLARLIPYRSLDDRIDGVVMTFVDITNRKQFELQLQNQAQELREQADVLAMAYAFIMDADYRIEVWNKGCEQLYGYTSQEAVGRIARELLKTEFPRPVAELDAELKQTGQWQGEVFQTAKDGSQIIVVCNWILHRRHDHQAFVILEVNTDITAQRTAEEALREADRNKDLFIATLAHELRNPLGAMTSSIALLEQDLADKPETEHAMGILTRQLGNLTRIVDDLLDVERLSRGRIILRKERVPLADVIDSAIENCRRGINSRKQEFNVSLPKEPVFLEGDGTRLAQVFSNLLDNASKYTPIGGKIDLSAEKKNDTLTIRVRDNGIGITREGLASIFNIYFQGEPAPGAELRGLGIGLALVRQLTEMHGGTVAVHSEGLGKGSEFVVKLPIITASQLKESPASAPATAQKGETRRRRKILVVDDNLDSAEAMGLVLEGEGHQTKIVHDGPAALACATEYNPDVAIVDIGLPGMDGYEVARRLRELIPGAKLLALSGWRIDAADQRTRDGNFDQFFTKPLQLSRLREVFAQINR